jgi:predicted GNAT family acetyltransferase
MVTHNQAAQRMEWVEDGHTCVLDYELSGTLMTITHTWVASELRGRGIAARLTRFALDTARSNGWKVRPVCSYANAFMRGHAEYGDLLA